MTGSGMFDHIRAEMRLYKENHTWQETGDFYKIDKAMAWRICNEGYEPKDIVIRKAIGLPPACHVIVWDGGDIPEGAQIVSQCLRLCVNKDCREPFITNSPTRRKCFKCSPYREHKRRTA